MNIGTNPLVLEVIILMHVETFPRVHSVYFYDYAKGLGKLWHFFWSGARPADMFIVCNLFGTWVYWRN
jgi:hypothetical protein